MKPIKGAISQTTTCSKEYKIVTNDKISEPYWDEGYYTYPRYRRGFKNSNKGIYSYQVRMYKSWKHNRITQYKTQDK